MLRNQGGTAEFSSLCICIGTFFVLYTKDFDTLKCENFFPIEQKSNMYTRVHGTCHCMTARGAARGLSIRRSRKIKNKGKRERIC